MSLDQLPLFAPPAPVAKVARLPPGPGRDPTFFAILVEEVLVDEIGLLVATERRRPWRAAGRHRIAPDGSRRR